MSDSFDLALYRWAQVYSQRQLETDFSTVRLFDTPAATLFLKRVAQLDDRMKCLLMKGLLTRFHVGAFATLQEPVDSEQAKVLEGFLEQGRGAITTGEWWELSPTIGNRLPRQQVRDRALHVFGEKFGPRVRDKTPAFLRFDVPIGTLSVRTLICIGGRGADLAYFQEVWSSDGTRIATGICALSLLGIIGGPVAWEEVGERNIDRALQAVTTGCLEFLSAVPGILKDLSTASAFT